MATGHPFAGGPCQSGRRSCQDGVEYHLGSKAVGFQVGAGVEAEPADPEEAGANHRERQVVGSQNLFAEAKALAKDDGADEACDTGIDVHN